MTRLGPELKAAVVAWLRERRGHGELTSADVRDAAAALEVGQRIVLRWLAEGDVAGRPRRGRYEITEEDWDAFYAWRGNVAAVYRERHAGGR